jgi:hypothetical protein
MSTKIRRKIGKNMKRLLIAITALVFSILLFMLLRTLLIKNTTEVEIEKYKYQLEKEINYEVYLAENKVYDNNVLGEDWIYRLKSALFSVIRCTPIRHNSAVVSG